MKSVAKPVSPIKKSAAQLYNELFGDTDSESDVDNGTMPVAARAPKVQVEKILEAGSLVSGVITSTWNWTCSVPMLIFHVCMMPLIIISLNEGGTGGGTDNRQETLAQLLH